MWLNCFPISSPKTPISTLHFSPATSTPPTPPPPPPPPPPQFALGLYIYSQNCTVHMKTFCSLRQWQWAVLHESLPKTSRKGHVNRSNQSPSWPPKNKNLCILRATFCNHRESPDNFSFFELLILSPKISFDELILKTILKTSSDIYFFKTFRKSDRAPKVPIFECKLCTKPNITEFSRNVQFGSDYSQSPLYLSSTCGTW